MTISEIALPDDSSMLVVGELIGAWMKDLNTVKIWVMQKYAVHSSWTKIIEFSVDPVLHCSLSILCFTNCGGIIGIDGESRLVKFNDKGKLIEHPFCHNYLSDKSARSEFVVYSESLFTLPDTGKA
ncbi:uncharacterized protein LOC131621997 [Vicia villosa]|uniref:uncharacterized protein LOC131621997 n=1 Tax=Vicia villosa TaxID=3911 RepID=UPI00273B31DF|nr:uncharacterized protein LOC131621997 [Vicia villosa]